MHNLPDYSLRNVRINWEQFSEDLRAHRARKRIDLRALARLLGSSAASVCRAESGKPCTPDLLMRLTISMGVDPLDYVRWDAPVNAAESSAD